MILETTAHYERLKETADPAEKNELVRGVCAALGNFAADLGAHRATLFPVSLTDYCYRHKFECPCAISDTSTFSGGVRLLVASGVCVGWSPHGRSMGARTRVSRTSCV